MNAKSGSYVGGNVGLFGYGEVPGSAFHVAFLRVFNPGYLRPFIGYRFTDYFALESGYTDFVNDSTAGEGHWGPDRYRLYAVDLEGKFIYPFESRSSMYGKAGLAYTYQSVFNQTYVNSIPSADTTARRILPLIGLGLSYNFNQHLAIDWGVTYFQQMVPIRSIVTLGLGLAYTF